MKNPRKILSILLILILCIVCVSCSSQKANQDITPKEVADKVINSLGINYDDIDDLYYSSGEEDYNYDDTLLKIMFPPSGDTTYTMDLFDEYAIIKYEKYKAVIFELGIFKVSSENKKTIENMCKERLVKVKNEVFEYNQENREKVSYVENAKVVVFDNYIYYVVTEDSAKAYDEIKSSIELK